jgi:hypothetical protein
MIAEFDPTNQDTFLYLTDAGMRTLQQFMAEYARLCKKQKEGGEVKNLWVSSLYRADYYQDILIRKGFEASKEHPTHESGNAWDVWKMMDLNGTTWLPSPYSDLVRDELFDFWAAGQGSYTLKEGKAWHFVARPSDAPLPAR